MHVYTIILWYILAKLRSFFNSEVGHPNLITFIKTTKTVYNVHGASTIIQI